MQHETLMGKVLENKEILLPLSIGVLSPFLLSNEWKDYVISLSKNITFPLPFTVKLGLAFPDKT